MIVTNKIHLYLYYFQSGHSCMSANSFHHQIVLAMKKIGKVYFLFDFEKYVRNFNTEKVDTKVMECNFFYNWKSKCPNFKLMI